MPSKKRAKQKRPVLQSAATAQAHAYVSDVDGSGLFLILGVHPYPSFRDGAYFTFYRLLARVQDGLQDAFIVARDTIDHVDRAFCESPFKERMSCQEALVLFVEPMVARTARLPNGAAQVLRWWQKQRRPEPVRCIDLVQPLLTEEQLAKIAGYSPQKASADIESGRIGITEQELLDHKQRFQAHFFAEKTYEDKWFLDEGNIWEILAESGQSGPLLPAWVKNARMVQKHVQMAAHMRLLYALAGMDEWAQLWSKELEIEIDHGLFAESGQVVSVLMLTYYLRSNTVSYDAEYFDCRPGLFERKAEEKKAVSVLRADSMWLCRSPPDILKGDPLFEDFNHVATNFVAQNLNYFVRDLRSRFPEAKIPCAYQISYDDLASSLLCAFADWEAERFFKRSGPLMTPHVVRPPVAFQSLLKKQIKECGITSHDTTLEIASKALATAWWSIACMAVYPAIFELCDKTGQHVRKPNSPAHPVSMSPMTATPEEEVQVIAMGFSACQVWLQRFVIVSASRLRKYLTVTVVEKQEVEQLERYLCPNHFVLQRGEGTGKRPLLLVPSDPFLERATSGDNNYIVHVFQVLAAKAPDAAFEVLIGTTRAAGKIDRDQNRARRRIEETGQTSTTRRGRGHCAGCGASEGEERTLYDCSRCHLVRYCCEACQKKHWKFHKRVCVAPDLIAGEWKNWRQMNTSS